jgi:hypothetical protein
MQLNHLLSRLIAFSLAFLLGICIYVFSVDLLRNCLNVDVYQSLKNPQRHASPFLPMRCGDGIIAYPKQCDAGPNNGFDTSSSLQTYLLWGKWFCSSSCTASDNFAFWEPKAK